MYKQGFYFAFSQAAKADIERGQIQWPPILEGESQKWIFQTNRDKLIRLTVWFN